MVIHFSTGTASGSLQQPVCSLDGHLVLGSFWPSVGKAMLSLSSAWETAELQILSAWMQRELSVFIPSFPHIQILMHCMHTSNY